MGLFSRKKKNKEVEETPVVVASQVTVPAEDADEIIAVISAALAAYTGGAQRITVINRVYGGNVPLWSLAGRQECMDMGKF